METRRWTISVLNPCFLPSYSLTPRKTSFHPRLGKAYQGKIFGYHLGDFLNLSEIFLGLDKQASFYPRRARRCCQKLLRTSTGGNPIPNETNAHATFEKVFHKVQSNCLTHSGRRRQSSSRALMRRESEAPLEWYMWLNILSDRVACRSSLLVSKKKALYQPVRMSVR